MGEKPHNSKLLREFSAGGVVFKKEAKKPLFLLIKPAGTDRWQLPKGQIDKDESSAETAAREVEEESGVKAKVIQKLGTSRYFFVLKGQRIFKTVTYFLMGYIGEGKDGHDHEVDETVFLPFDKAYERLTFKDDKNILTKAKEMI